MLLTAFAIVEGAKKGYLTITGTPDMPIEQARESAIGKFGRNNVSEIEAGPDGTPRFRIRLTLQWDGKSLPHLVHAAGEAGKDVSHKVRAGR